MRIAIIIFPGAHTEQQTELVVSKTGMLPEKFLWGESIEKLAEFSGFILLGGCPDDLSQQDRLVSALKLESEKGKPILGIGSGARVLFESGILPGTENFKPCVSLIKNPSAGESLHDAFLIEHFQYNAFTRFLSDQQRLKMPASGEEFFRIPPALLLEIRANGLDILHYRDEAGVEHIAALSNKAGNVMAILLHPELCEEGDVIFRSMQDYIATGVPSKVRSLAYYPR